MPANPAIRGLFVTGTDTGVGKTTIAVALLRYARRQGMTPIPFKPVETGCQPEALDALCSLARRRSAHRRVRRLSAPPRVVRSAGGRGGRGREPRHRPIGRSWTRACRLWRFPARRGRRRSSRPPTAPTARPMPTSRRGSAFPCWSWLERRSEQSTTRPLPFVKLRGATSLSPASCSTKRPLWQAPCAGQCRSHRLGRRREGAWDVSLSPGLMTRAEIPIDARRRL